MNRELKRAMRLFLYIVPLKQGLKRDMQEEVVRKKFVFIHSSIKTRIETNSLKNAIMSSMSFYT